MPGITTEKLPKSRKASRKVVPMTPKTPEQTAASPPEATAEPPEPPQAAQAEAVTPSEYVGASREPFPPPPRPQGKGGIAASEAAMDYWRSLPPAFIARTDVYINRLWPILDHQRELTDTDRALIAARKKAYPTKFIDKPPAPFGPDTRMEFLRRYGSGVYKVYINDAGVRGKAAKDNPDLQRHTLLKFTVSVQDPDYPPVLDPSRPDKGLGILDLSHPENQSYIADLRMKGVLPLEAVSDMNADVVKDLAGKVGQLADQVAAGKQEQLLAQVKAEIEKSGGGGGAAQTLLMLKMLDNSTKAPAPMADTLTPVISLFQSQVTSLQTELREERAERRKQEEARLNQPQPDPFSYLERMADTLKKAKEILSGGFGTNGAGGIGESVVKHASRMSGTLEFFAEVIPKIVDSPILNALANKIALGAMMPAAPNGTTAPPSTTPASPAADADAKLLKFVQEVLTPAMVEYLEADSSGADFAEWVYCGFPNRLPELQKRGPGVILATYQSSPLWPRLMPRAAQFQRFVSEFCAWKPNEDEETGPEPEEKQAANGKAGNPSIIEFDDPLEGQPL